MRRQELIPHLFRTEFGKITNVLCKFLGVEYIDIAEDIAGETFLAALENWPYKGIPPNPAGWLYTVAKNKAFNYVERSKTYSKKVLPGIAAETSDDKTIDLDMSDKNITDSQLQMLFAICHPVIPVEAQISLALRILCGFGIDEIANALLDTQDAVSKRIFRAKQKLRKNKIKLEFPEDDAIDKRLDTVLTTIYLLFSEGYYSESNDAVLRKDICLEAMRLNYMLVENSQTSTPQVNALFSLMCFHASRFEARENDSGEIILYNEQDDTLWNTDLIARGAYYLRQASGGDKVSKYHLEAAIAYWHTLKEDTAEKWNNILQLYNQLLAMQYSPVAALNRIYALSKVKGSTEAIAAAEELKLNSNHYYFVLLGELYSGIDKEKAIEYLSRALILATTRADKQTIVKKLNCLC